MPRPGTMFAFVILACCLQSAFAVDYYFSFDIPAKMGITEFHPNEIVHRLKSSYSLQQTLADGLQMGGIELLPDGTWLFAPAYPVTLQNQEFLPTDIVLFDGSSYSLVLHGADHGIPPEARIDALMKDSTGRLLVSLDIAVDSPSGILHPTDLSLIQGGLGLYWSGQTAGVPAYVNLVGAALNGNDLVVSFDVPVALEGVEYQPGQLVRWNGGTSFSLFAQDAGWPVESRPSDFTFHAAAGSITNVLNLTKAPNGDVVLDWEASCNKTDSDYEIYSGSIGDYYSHASLLCSTNGETTQAIAPPSGSVYFLIVPRNATAEGSYGKSTDGSERPAAPDACKPSVVACSP